MVTMAEDEQGKGDHVPIVEHQARGGGEMCAELLSMRCTLHRIFPFRTGCSFILWKRDMGVKGPKFREEFDWDRTSTFKPGLEREKYQMASWLHKFLLEKSRVFLSLRFSSSRR